MYVHQKPSHLPKHFAAATIYVKKHYTHPNPPPPHTSHSYKYTKNNISLFFFFFLFLIFFCERKKEEKTYALDIYGPIYLGIVHICTHR